MRTKITLAAAFAGLAGFTFAADTCNQLAGKQVSGLAVYSPDTTTGPSLGQSFEIKWQPTGTYTTVSILLLKGPSTNVVPHGCIVNNVPNSGSYTWTVPSDLQVQSTGYGIQIIADGTGDFQYSSQFGITKGSGSSASASATTDANGDTVITSTTLVSGQEITTTMYHYSTSTSSCSTTSSSYHSHPTAISSHKILHSHNATHVRPTAYSSKAVIASTARNVTESVSPTVTMSVPASLSNIGGSGGEITSQPSAAASTTSSAPTTTAAKGAAPKKVAGGVLAGLGAAAALLL